MNVARFRTLIMWLCIPMLLSTLPGCVGLVVMGAQQVISPATDDDDRIEKQMVAGITRKDELVEWMGEPLHELNEGRVLVFGGRQRGRNLIQLLSEEKKDEHRLIAVFDDQGVLRDHLWVGRKRGGKKALVAAQTDAGR